MVPSLMPFPPYLSSVSQQFLVSKFFVLFVRGHTMWSDTQGATHTSVLRDCSLEVLSELNQSMSSLLPSAVSGTAFS